MDAAENGIAGTIKTIVIAETNPWQSNVCTLADGKSFFFFNVDFFIFQMHVRKFLKVKLESKNWYKKYTVACVKVLCVCFSMGLGIFFFWNAFGAVTIPSMKIQKKANDKKQNNTHTQKKTTKLNPKINWIYF